MMTRSHRGFTLIEMIMVIVITGIIGGIVAVFLKAPVDQYMDVARRAEISDIADTAFRRVARDLRLALPNSVRVTGACGGGLDTCFLEFLPAPAGGRYCAAAPCDDLDFSNNADGTFAVIGPGVTVDNGDSIVVYNLGIPGADAYQGTSRRVATVFGNGLNAVTYDPNGVQFPFESPSRRFHVISTPVTYACDGVGTLWRFSGYAIPQLQTSVDTIAELNALANVQTARMATNVSDCRFSYTGLAVAQRSGVVTMQLAITRDNETASLIDAAHVSNQP